MFRVDDRAFDSENSDKPGKVDFQLFKKKRLITEYLPNPNYFGKFMIYFENFQNYCFKKGFDYYKYILRKEIGLFMKNPF